jgi:small-conductance mechanosensitive channel
MRIRILITGLVLATLAQAATPPEPPPARNSAAAAAPANPAAVTTADIAVLSADQVLQILDQTVDWYRTLGTQQQSSTQPSDLLILYANQQTAAQVVNLAFDVARANAELLSSEASTAASHSATAGPIATAGQSTLASPQDAADGRAAKLRQQRLAIQGELASARAAGKSELDAKRSELQGELDMVNARLNLLDMMSTFVAQSNSRVASANALKAHIDAIAASVPGLGTPAENASANAANSASTKAATGATSASAIMGAGTAADAARVGIWGLVTRVIALRSKGSTINAIDDRTASLDQMLSKVRSAPMERLEAMSRQSDALAQSADSARDGDLKNMRDQLDTLAWLFQQTSAMLVPMIKEGVLLQQYRRNLSSWHETVQRQYHEALRVLLIRTAALLAVLVLIFAGGEVWRRMVLRYTAELRRRQQLLLIRKLTLGAIVLLIIGMAFFTELGSFATFAGLITAGVAVAMQSVLTCIVGYFLLIGKYGLRVGDRVQIGNVAGEIVDLGMIRLHLMEFGGDGRLGATGRVVAFPNSIVFQATGGLFRQIPGVTLVWHELVVALPAGRDYATFKNELRPGLEHAMNDYREAIQQQSRQIEQSTASASMPTPEPQVQLRLTAGGAEVVVRYPVQLEHAAEVDEKVSQAVSAVLNPRAAAALNP